MIHDQLFSACRSFQETALLRRELLRIGGLGLLGLTAPRLLRAESSRTPRKARAKSVIFLYQFGGPSHLDTFDMKPEAPDGIRSHYQGISSALPGVPICEHLPEMAKVMDKVTLVRTVHHAMKNHNSAAYFALTIGNDVRVRGTNMRQMRMIGS